MRPEKKKDIIFVTYMLTVIALAVIYFTVPERKDFMEFQIKWWKELLHVISSYAG